MNRPVDHLPAVVAPSASPAETASAETDQDRSGLDLLASVVDQVAEELPPSLVSVPPFREPPPQPAGGWLRAALAAGIACIVLGWPTYLGLVRLPQVEQQLAAAGPTSYGPIELTWLSPPRTGGRSASAPRVVRVEQPVAGPVVWLLELPMAARASLSSGALIELRQAVTGPIETWHIDGEQLAKQLAAHDGVPLLVPPADWPTGDYQLYWLDEQGQEVARVDMQLVAP